MSPLPATFADKRVVLFSALLKSADWAARSPLLRGLVLNIVKRRLKTAYEEHSEDSDRLMYLKWLGRHLEPCLDRIMNERPAAARAVLRFFGTWVSDMYRRAHIREAGGVTPCTVVIEPTDRCNLNCPGCYAKSTRDGSDLPFERMVQIVEQVIDMGVTLITVSGGEPFLREKKDRAITRLAERFNDRAFLVYTNGTLIDRETARRLGRVGNIFPAISVEGFEHQTDARRGKGIYELNRRVRGWLAEEGVMTGFSATITRENADSIATDEFIELRIAEGDLFGWFFLLQPIGRSPRPDLMATPEQRAKLRNILDKWRAESRPIFLGDFWNDGPLVGGCIAGGRSYFHIYANGDISPCVFSPVAAGNIFDIIDGKSPYKSLDEFVQRHPMFVAFRQEQEKITDYRRPCLLIDHPDAFKRICQSTPWRPAKNMPEGYLDGEIRRHIEQMAEAWREEAERMPELIAFREAKQAEAAERKVG